MRCLLVWIVATLVVGVIVQITMVSVRRAPRGVAAVRGTPIDVVLTDLAALALALCAMWLWLVTTIVIASAWRGVDVSARPPRGVPAVVRRVVLAACGIALVGGLTAPSYAEGPRPPTPQLRVQTSLAGLPLPDRATSAARPEGRPERSPTRPAADSTRSSSPPGVGPGRIVLVREGDSLWAIAAADLPAGSSTTQIAARWQEIYRANHTLIGPDPDVIAVGLQLHLPRKDER